MQRFITLAILAALAGSMAFGQGAPGTPLQVVTYTNITSVSKLDGSGYVDNRSQFTRQSNGVSFRCTGTGTWTVTLSYADGVPAGFTSYGASGVVTQAAPASGIGYGIGYHDYYKWVFSGSNASTVVCQSSATKNYWAAPSTNALVFPITPAQGGSNVTSVMQYGAVGNGIANDTAAITSAINTVCGQSAVGSLIFPAGGTYEIAASVANNPILPICNGLTIDVEGTIQVKAGSGSYYSVFGNLGTVSNFTLIGSGTIDENTANNPLVSSGDLAARPRGVVLVGNPTSTQPTGISVTIRDITVINSAGTWVFRSGATPTIITHTKILNIGGGLVQRDSSIIYTDGFGSVIQGNRITCSAIAANMCLTAIETHGSGQVVNGNMISNLQTGMNITGVSPTTDSGISVTGNTISGVLQCIDIFSMNTQGASNYGIANASVTGNTCVVNQLSWSAAETAGTQSFGIQLNGASTLAAKNLKVNSNVVTFDLSTSAGEPYNLASLGIGYYDATATGIACVDCDFGGNLVINAPLAAFHYEAAGQNISFDNDIAIDAGSHLNVGIPSFDKAGFRLSPLNSSTAIVGNISANNSKAIDDLATARMVYGYVITAQPSGSVSLDGVEVTCVDPVCAALLSGFDIGTAQTPAPYIRARSAVPLAALLPNRGSTMPLVGSSIIWERGPSTSISGGTNASSAVLTTATAPATGLVISISGGTGNWAAANGLQVVTHLTGTTFSIPVDSTAFGAVTGTLIFSIGPVAYNFTGNQGWSNPDVGHITALSSGNLSGCGGGATFAGTDRAGIIVMGSGVGTCVITFTQPFVAAPIGPVSPTASGYTYSVNVTALAITITGSSVTNVFRWSLTGN